MIHNPMARGAASWRSAAPCSSRVDSSDRQPPPVSAPDPSPDSGPAPDLPLGELLDGLYDGLRREARKQLAARPLHTLQPTALLNEALVRLLTTKQRTHLNEGQLCTYVTKVMRTVLVE